MYASIPRPNPLYSAMMKRFHRGLGAVLTAFLLMLSAALHAGEIHVAVAANFTAPLKIIAAGFEKDTGHKVTITLGATGKFYAQIKSGAPYDVFLSADDETPARLEKEGDAVAGTRFTYATGRLVLWSANAHFVDTRGEILKTGNFTHIALASPKLAPYGAAAVETLKNLGLLATLAPKFVQGESIGQTFSFVSTGNAPLGFVALSQVHEDGRITHGSAWVVPSGLHAPLQQAAVVLTNGKGKGVANAATAAFMAYLKTDKTQAVIRSYGYEVGP
jgi:molybdate transport system substrate-binding protein